MYILSVLQNYKNNWIMEENMNKNKKMKIVKKIKKNSKNIKKISRNKAKL